ncbi:SMP-30/gluconolactonase/LRE family protein [Parapedobacter koreensis]|uniref:Sugar lactone lactonase YvrE n=1 Tax=Parapedobacter koreensis TaxID=332977 RepID=A0A1H7LUD9_9SPHI|nr:SMP-30/gluconolactonase/LRE family protein [Parapedobacter koreensis]SEL02479.1 Sugar lactone lactonase YvrE [Parapedobacter koreensis]
MEKKQWIALMIAVFMVGCNPGQNQGGLAEGESAHVKNHSGNVRPFIKLPPEYNTPDGLAVSGDGTLILSVPNFNNRHLMEQGLINEPSGPFMAIIDRDNNIAHWYDFKPNDMHPETGTVGAMDCDFGPDGHLYVADMQVFFDKNYKSRILRINVVNGKPTSVDVVVEGFIASNGMYWQGNHLFVTESVLEARGDGLTSGVYAFSLEELQGEKPVRLQAYKNGKGDDHLVVTFESDNHMGFGADGLTFDDEGFLYTTVIEKGQIFRSRLDVNNKAVETKLFAESPNMGGPDGLVFSRERSLFYVADFLNNAVHAIDRDGYVITLHQNGDTDGADGKLDQPAEVALRGNELIIVNMDMAWATPGLSVNTKVDLESNLSKIDLK